jgi:hypothetical protein
MEMGSKWPRLRWTLWKPSHIWVSQAWFCQRDIAYNPQIGSCVMAAAECMGSLSSGTERQPWPCWECCKRMWLSQHGNRSAYRTILPSFPTYDTSSALKKMITRIWLRFPFSQWGLKAVTSIQACWETLRMGGNPTCGAPLAQVTKFHKWGRKVIKLCPLGPWADWFRTLLYGHLIWE